MVKCKYEGTGIWDGRCIGTKEVDPCPGYDKCKQYKPNYTTNADRIRAMSDEELATFISEIADECEKNTECHQHCYGCDIEYCVYESCLKWLQQPSFCSYGEPKDGD